MRASLVSWLWVGLAIFAGATFGGQQSQPERSPTKPALPAALAMSETEVFRLLIPDFDTKLAANQNARDNLDGIESNFAPRITAALETNFGWRGREFLLVSVDSTVGLCGGCGSTEYAILDVRERRVLWRRHYDGHGGAKFSKVFFAMPGAPIVTALEYEGSQGGGGVGFGVWLRPTLQADGTIACEVVWRDLVEFGYTGNRGGGSFYGCGQMRQLSRPGEYLYERRTFYGGNTAYDSNKAPEADPAPVMTPAEDLACVSCPDPEGCGTVEIRRTERWTLSKGGSMLERSALSAERIDNYESEVFPFNLPQSEVSWGPSRLSAQVSGLENNNRVVKSPAGLFVACTTNARYQASLVLETSAGVAIRSIPLWFRDDFEGHPIAIGWSEDERRVFAVVEFGLDDRALLSFSVTGKDDYWERLLTADKRRWRDGFILSAPRPAR